MKFLNLDKNNVVDQDIESIIGSIGILQDSYFEKHGKYFQSVKNTETANNSFTIKSPTDEKHNASVDYEFSAQLHCVTEIHEWVGTEPGYKYVLSFIENEIKKYRIIENNGNDTGWFVVNEK